MKNLLLDILGISHKNQEVREIKQEVKDEVVAVTKTYNKINKLMVKKGITLDIARAMGILK